MRFRCLAGPLRIRPKPRGGENATCLLANQLLVSSLSNPDPKAGRRLRVTVDISAFNTVNTKEILA
jgi:hypothetical protein